MAPVYTPFSAVCNRTFTRSKGWPTTTAHIPPTPPAVNDRRPADKDDLVASATSVATSSLEGRSCLDGREDRGGLEEEEEEEEDGEGDIVVGELGK